MKFNKEAISMGGLHLEEGAHVIGFDDVTKKTSQSGREMLVVTLKDDKGATFRYNIVDTADIEFDDGSSSLDNTLSRILYSISDAGFTIPDVDYTFENFGQFLGSKPYKAYVNIKPQKNNSKYMEAVFISKEQFDKQIEKQVSETLGETSPFDAPKEKTDVNPFA